MYYSGSLLYLSSSECTPGDLLLCNNTFEPSPNELCCDDSSICVQYTGTSVGSTAQYTTSDDYCITTELVRTCTPSMEWDGQKPTASEGTLNQGKYTIRFTVR